MLITLYSMCSTFTLYLSCYLHNITSYGTALVCQARAHRGTVNLILASEKDSKGWFKREIAW